MNLQSASQDKGFLENMLKSDFTFPYEGINAAQLVFALMPKLKSTDAVLRDELSYSIIGRIVINGLLSSSELENVLDIAASDDYLFFGIGDVDSDTVFARAFAILVIAAVLDYDAENLGVRPDRIHQVARAILDYAHLERDYRGFVDVDGKGWAHSVAHTADALDSCAHHPVIGREERFAVLDAIADMVLRTGPHTHNEDDRLAFPMFRIIQAEQIPYERLSEWIRKFDLQYESSPKCVTQQVTVQHFLRSLYFLVSWEQESHPILQDIGRVLKRLNTFYRSGILPTGP